MAELVDILLMAEIQNLMAFIEIYGVYGASLNWILFVFSWKFSCAKRTVEHLQAFIWEKCSGRGGGVQCKNLPDSCCSSEEEAASGNETAEPWLKWIAMDLWRYMDLVTKGCIHSADSFLAMGFPYFKQIGDGLRSVPGCVSLRAFHLFTFVSNTVKREVFLSSLVDLACN